MKTVGIPSTCLASPARCHVSNAGSDTVGNGRRPYFGSYVSPDLTVGARERGFCGGEEEQGEGGAAAFSREEEGWRRVEKDDVQRGLHHHRRTEDLRICSRNPLPLPGISPVCVLALCLLPPSDFTDS